jgi:peptidylprolyl isomerase
MPVLAQILTEPNQKAFQGEHMIRAEKMDTVKVNYTGTLSDGTIFDQSPEDRPLHFIIGKQEVIPGFEDAVEGMRQGESKTTTIPCEQAYGKIKPELIEQVDRSLLGEEVLLQVGGQLQITNQDGTIFCVMVREIKDGKVTLDANHPLAGKDLIFEIELLDVNKDRSKTSLPFGM